jgi:hypothetical protein
MEQPLSYAKPADTTRGNPTTDHTDNTDSQEIGSQFPRAAFLQRYR